MSDQPIPTPELDRMAAVRDESQAIGTFLDTSRYALGEYIPCEQWHDDGDTCRLGSHYTPVTTPIEQILADYFDIDLAKVEAERRVLLAALAQGQR